LRCQSALKALIGIISVFRPVSNAATPPVRRHRGGAAFERERAQRGSAQVDWILMREQTR